MSSRHPDHRLPPLLVLALVAALGGVACAAKERSGPVPAGVTSRAFVGQAELEVRYRFEPRGASELVLLVDTVGREGGVGKVRHSLRLSGFSVVGGDAAWDVDVTASRTETHRLVLRADGRTPSVTVVTHHLERDVELAADTLRFWTDDDGRLDECEAADPVCR